MTPGRVVLIPLQEPHGPAKPRPAVILSLLPGNYQSLLISGISTQTHAAQQNWDELIGPGDADFKQSGLRLASLICLSFIRAAGKSEVIRIIGKIDPARLTRLQQLLSDHLRP